MFKALVATFYLATLHPSGPDDILIKANGLTEEQCQEEQQLQKDNGALAACVDETYGLLVLAYPDETWSSYLEPTYTLWLPPVNFSFESGMAPFNVYIWHWRY